VVAWGENRQFSNNYQDGLQKTAMLLLLLLLLPGQQDKSIKAPISSVSVEACT